MLCHSSQCSHCLSHFYSTQKTLSFEPRIFLFPSFFKNGWIEKTSGGKRLLLIPEASWVQAGFLTHRRGMGNFWRTNTQDWSVSIQKQFVCFTNEQTSRLDFKGLFLDLVTWTTQVFDVRSIFHNAIKNFVWRRKYNFEEKNICTQNLINRNTI